MAIRQTDNEYRDRMDMPVECLAIAMWGIDGEPKNFLDYEIVEEATRKIEMLKKMLIASGLNEDLLKAVMES